MKQGTIDGQWEESPPPRAKTKAPPTQSDLVRESWLWAGAKQMFPWLKAAGFDPPAKVRISVGWPKGGKGGRGKVIGQCWPASASNDEHREVFISPELDKPVEALSTLLHELVHAALPEGTGHKGDFIKLCKALGFNKPWTMTPRGDELQARITELAARLGPYPHAALNPKAVKKQSTRLLLATCGGCGAKWRASATVVEQYQPAYPTCPCGGTISPDNNEEGV